MSQRIDYDALVPNAPKALFGVYNYTTHSSINEQLRVLIELRVSQINGCSYCIDLHSNQARAAGELQQRLDCLPVWQEVPFFSDREKAALAWAESVTLVSQTNVPDDVFEQASKYFSETELVDLTMVTISINSWNRLAISFRKVPLESNK